MKKNFLNQTILITGASMGIGEDIAKHFAAAGANLILVARSEDKLKSLCHALSRPAQSFKYFTCDLSQGSQVETLITQLQSLEKLDGVVHNAGLGLYGAFETYSEKDIRRLFEVNYFSILKLTQGLLPLLKKSKQPRMAFISSVLGWRSIPRLGIYASSKAALDSFVEALRVELATTSIKVINIYPGRTKTGFTEHAHSTGWRPFPTDQGGVSSDYVARKVLKAYQKAKRDEYVVWSNRAVIWTNFLFPKLVDWFLKIFLGRLYR